MEWDPGKILNLGQALPGGVLGFLEIVGALLTLVATAILVAEFAGWRITFRPPFFKKTGLKWNAQSVAIAGLSGALVGALMSLTGGIVLIPGVVSLNIGRGLEPVLGVLFGIPGVFGGIIASIIFDVFTGKFAFWSVPGAIWTAMPAWIYFYFVVELGNDPTINRPKTLGWYALAFVINTIAKVIGLVGSMGFLNLLPEEILWGPFAATGLIGPQPWAHWFVGVPVIKLLGPLVRRGGLLPTQQEPQLAERVAEGE
jgi:hypothetical protein